MNIKVALCEDNIDYRESLQQYIDSKDGFEIVLALPTTHQILDQVRQCPPHVILMDIDMPDVDGIQATRIVKGNFPQLEVLMLTVYDDDDKIFGAILAGATGYLLKKTPPPKILEAIREVFEGGASMNASIVKRVLSFFSDHRHASKANEYLLSDREKTLLKRIVQGDSYKMIADHCGIAIGTVRFHIILIFISSLELSACGGDCKSVLAVPIKYQFLQQVNLVPYQEKYHIGDTIRFGFTDTGKMVFDTISNTFIKADSLGYTIRAEIERLDNYKQPIPADGYFYTSRDGLTFVQNTSGGSFAVTFFDTNVTACSTGPNLNYSAGIIPRQTGIYLLSFLLLEGMDNCYSGSPVPAAINFQFALPDCNEDLLTGISSSSVDTADHAVYAKLALAKEVFIFEIE
jgi:DNA-binding NarL/FixJ family response regulator